MSEKKSKLDTKIEEKRKAIADEVMELIAKKMESVYTVAEKTNITYQSILNFKKNKPPTLTNVMKMLDVIGYELKIVKKKKKNKK
jgi:hypothetical protein